MAISKKTKGKPEDALTRTQDLKSAEDPTQCTYTVDVNTADPADLPSVTKLLNRKSYLAFKKEVEEKTKLAPKTPESLPSNVVPLKAKAASRIKPASPDLILWDQSKLQKSKTGFERWVGTILSLGAESILYFERDPLPNDQMSFAAKAGVFNSQQETLWKGMQFSSTDFKEFFQEIEKNGWLETQNTPELSKIFGTTGEDQLALVGFRIKGQLHALVAFVSKRPFSDPAKKLFKKVSKKQDTTQVFKKAA